MQVNMNALIKGFFNSVRKYTSEIMAMYEDPIQKEELQKEYNGILAIENALIKIANTKADERYGAEFKELVSEVMYNGHSKFGIGSGRIFVNPRLKENSETKWEAHNAFFHVLTAFGNYYSSGSVFGNDPEPVLKALKSWRYKTSKNIMKDFVFPFLTLSRVAKGYSK